jgi:pimeloyl-ACP methyl ester carboxylesterase
MHTSDRKSDHGTERSPGLLLLAMEWRALWELGASIAASPILATVPNGDGHPVLVLPGLAAGDMSTLPLRQFLRLRGYAPHGWGLGLNLGPRPGVIERSLERLADLSERYRRKVSLIGWSLGGIYAREFAKRSPEAVRQVITLGAAFTGHPKATNAWRLYELVAGHKIGAPEIHEPLRMPPPVPTTSIYSRTDGVVAWQCCIEKEGPHTENIEVEASHFGLGMNPAALYAIADRLAQPVGKWRPFDRGSGMRAWIYRDPRRRGWL